MMTIGLAMLSLDSMAQTTRQGYKDIVDISLTPGAPRRQNGCFTDMGSWMGFTLSEKEKPATGFCGPFSIYYRNWYARSLVSLAGASLQEQSYYPGEVRMRLKKDGAEVQESLQFADARTALLSISNPSQVALTFTADSISSRLQVSQQGNTITIGNLYEERILLTFPQQVKLQVEGNNYVAQVPEGVKQFTAAISIVEQDTEASVQNVHTASLLANPSAALQANDDRWNGYLRKVIRDDMPADYNRVAAKSIVTLLSNWRVKRGDLYHDGIVPSHAVGYFVGCWAWDCWRFSAGMASFFPELAKDNIRVMFDYQQPDGMVIDCIYPDASENNARDSKPPLAAWAVNEVYEHTHDLAFVKEMYPKLLKYHKWWYEKRDHDKNHICEFGSTDGTLVAAAWESGMDNAIRFDGTRMLKNDAENAWSTD